MRDFVVHSHHNFSLDTSSHTVQHNSHENNTSEDNQQINSGVSGSMFQFLGSSAGKANSRGSIKNKVRADEFNKLSSVSKASLYKIVKKTFQ